jgi:hypothetical protein
LNFGSKIFKMEWYKNNNGNYSLGLVPIHRWQPRLFAMPDYCYSDRLLLQIRDLVSATLCFPALPVTAEPSGCPFPRRGVVPGRSVFQAAGAPFPKDQASVSDFRGRNPFFLKPSDLIIERTFPVFADLLNITDAKSC